MAGGMFIPASSVCKCEFLNYRIFGHFFYFNFLRNLAISLDARIARTAGPFAVYCLCNQSRVPRTHHVGTRRVARSNHAAARRVAAIKSERPRVSSPVAAQPQEE